ncbi:MAG: MBL fold metallo-hydrolase [Oscillospiraceae bacterium]|nr:MBL fold metallo-hydrolase [Oscillospiraceae bacterium]
MRILTLIEDTRTSKKLHCEHGLSYLVELPELQDRAVLIDTGASSHFIKNAEKLGADLKAASDLSCVISHNHDDHTGGLDALLKLRPDVRVFARKAITGSYYRRVGPLNVKVCRDFVHEGKYEDNFILFEAFQEINEGVYAMGCEVFDEKFMLRDKRLLMKERVKNRSRFVPDDFKHEIFAVVFPHFKNGKADKAKGCVVISSCSHCGIVNILETVKRTWDVPILGVVGGFHMEEVPGVSEAFVKRMATRLSELSQGCVYTCHCTGEKAYERLKAYMGDQIQTLRTGEELKF